MSEDGDIFYAIGPCRFVGFARLSWNFIGFPFYRVLFAHVESADANARHNGQHTENVPGIEVFTEKKSGHRGEKKCQGVCEWHGKA